MAKLSSDGPVGPMPVQHADETMLGPVSEGSLQFLVCAA